MKGREGQKALSKNNMEKNWYVIHTYSGYENKVKTNLEKRLETMGMEDKIFRVLVTEDEETEIKLVCHSDVLKIRKQRKNKVRNTLGNNGDRRKDISGACSRR